MANPGDKMIQQLLNSMGLVVDVAPVIVAVRERGFEGAQFVAVVLATVAYIESGVSDVERAIDQAVETLERRKDEIRP